MAKRSSWKNERASVSRKGASRARSNKFSGSDTTKRPEPGSRSKVWIGGYTRADGTKVAGHFRQLRGGSSSSGGSAGGGGRRSQGGSTRGGGRRGSVAKSRSAPARSASRGGRTRRR